VRDSKTSNVKSAYIIAINTIYFRNEPAEITIAHELEHWAQAQRVGPALYLEQLQSEKAFREFEESADATSRINAHKLTGKY